MTNTEHQPSGIKEKLGKISKYTGEVLDRAISRIGTSGVLFDETATPIPVPEQILAVAPISTPQEKGAQLLYSIAYHPDNREHSLREVTQDLFNRKGAIPAGISGEIFNLNGMIQTQSDGSITSKVISEAYKKQKKDTIKNQILTKNPAKSTPITLGNMPFRLVKR